MNIAIRRACSLPPCGGGVGRGVVIAEAARAPTPTPTPSPSPQGGGERARRVAPTYISPTGRGLISATFSDQDVGTLLPLHVERNRDVVDSLARLDHVLRRL